MSVNMKEELLSIYFDTLEATKNEIITSAKTKECLVWYEKYHWGVSATYVYAYTTTLYEFRLIDNQLVISIFEKCNSVGCIYGEETIYTINM